MELSQKIGEFVTIIENGIEYRAYASKPWMNGIDVLYNSDETIFYHSENHWWRKSQIMPVKDRDDMFIVV